MRKQMIFVSVGIIAVSIEKVSANYGSAIARSFDIAIQKPFSPARREGMFNIFGESSEELERQNLEARLQNMNSGWAEVAKWLKNELDSIKARLDKLEQEALRKAKDLK